MQTIQQKITQRNQQQREDIRTFLAGLRAGDIGAFALCGKIDLIYDGWRKVMRKVAQLPGIHPRIRRHFADQVWLYWGDHLRGEIQDDLLLIDAMRNLMPPYTGPAMTLYRGDGAWNRKCRTYGMSWTSSAKTAKAFARGDWRIFDGGSVLLKATVQTAGIVCKMRCGGEQEYIVDRRHLRDVSVVQRFGQINIDDWSAYQAAGFPEQWPAFKPQ